MLCEVTRKYYPWLERYPLVGEKKTVCAQRGEAESRKGDDLGLLYAKQPHVHVDALPVPPSEGTKKKHRGRETPKPLKSGTRVNSL